MVEIEEMIEAMQSLDLDERKAAIAALSKILLEVADLSKKLNSVKDEAYALLDLLDVVKEHVGNMDISAVQTVKRYAKSKADYDYAVENGLVKGARICTDDEAKQTAQAAQEMKKYLSREIGSKDEYAAAVEEKIVKWYKVSQRAIEVNGKRD